MKGKKKGKHKKRQIESKFIMAQQSQNNYYLFFSNHCNHCKHFLSSVSGTPLSSIISPLCVDNKQIKIPPFVKSVPTLYIANQQRILTGDALLMWLNTELGKFKQGNVQQQQQPQQPQQQQPQQQPHNVSMPSGMDMVPGGMGQSGNMNSSTLGGGTLEGKNVRNGAITGSDDVMAYHQNELGMNFSDGYSFIDDQNKALSHSFTFIGDSPSGLNGANAPPSSGNLMMNSSGGGGGSSSPKSEKEAMMAKAYEQLMASRKNDIPQPVMRQ